LTALAWVKGLMTRDVRFGSKADIAARPRDVRFTPKADMETFGYSEGRLANDAISTSVHDHAKQRWQ